MDTKPHTVWEIRLSNQDPVRVEVPEDRNLSEEYAAFDDYHSQGRWRFWNRKSPFWQVTDAVLIHKDMVIGVLPKKTKPVKAVVGF